jgi:hypothetical protein
VSSACVAAGSDDATCAAIDAAAPAWSAISNACVAAGSSDGEPGSGPPPCVAHCNWDNDNCPQDCDTSSCSTRKNWHMAFSWIHRRLPPTNSLCLSHSPLCFLCCWC